MATWYCDLFLDSYEVFSSISPIDWEKRYTVFFLLYTIVGGGKKIRGVDDYLPSTIVQQRFTRAWTQCVVASSSRHTDDLYCCRVYATVVNVLLCNFFLNNFLFFDKKILDEIVAKDIVWLLVGSNRRSLRPMIETVDFPAIDLFVEPRFTTVQKLIDLSKNKRSVWQWNTVLVCWNERKIGGESQ